MKILVCGGRNFGNLRPELLPRPPQKMKEYEFIMRTLDKLCMGWPKLEEDKYGNWLPNVIIISGAAKGVDTVAIDWAVVNWCQFREYPANWDLYGRKAGPIRNEEMLVAECPDLVVAFPGGSGTADMVKRAKKAGIPVKEIVYE